MFAMLTVDLSRAQPSFAAALQWRPAGAGGRQEASHSLSPRQAPRFPRRLDAPVSPRTSAARPVAMASRETDREQPSSVAALLPPGRRGDAYPSGLGARRAPLQQSRPISTMPRWRRITSGRPRHGPSSSGSADSTPTPTGTASAHSLRPHMTRSVRSTTSNSAWPARIEAATLKHRPRSATRPRQRVTRLSLTKSFRSRKLPYRADIVDPDQRRCLLPQRVAQPADHHEPHSRPGHLRLRQGATRLQGRPAGHGLA